eukprot:8749722-Pyramimonas_sp.AAC.1
MIMIILNITLAHKPPTQRYHPYGWGGTSSLIGDVPSMSNPPGRGGPSGPRDLGQPGGAPPSEHTLP